MRNGRNRKIRLKRLSSGGSPSKWIAQDILKRTGSDGVTSLPVSFQRANACVRGGKRIPVLAYAQKFLGISGKRSSHVKGHRFLTHQRLKTLVFRRIFCSPNRRCLPVEQRRVNHKREFQESGLQKDARAEGNLPGKHVKIGGTALPACPKPAHGRHRWAAWRRFRAAGARGLFRKRCASPLLHRRSWPRQCRRFPRFPGGGR